MGWGERMNKLIEAQEDILRALAEIANCGTTRIANSIDASVLKEIAKLVIVARAEQEVKE